MPQMPSRCQGGATRLLELPERHRANAPPSAGNQYGAPDRFSGNHPAALIASRPATIEGENAFILKSLIRGSPTHPQNVEAKPCIVNPKSGGHHKKPMVTAAPEGENVGTPPKGGDPFILAVVVKR